MKYSFLISAVLLLAACAPSQVGVREIGEVDGVPFFRMRAERLPDLPKPRGGHHIVLLGDEPTLVGGITDGFVLEPTIAYLKDGDWHEVPMKYSHYYGFTTLLPDGTLMLGGGCAENFGIGQSWGVEVYDPATHSCKAVGIMSRKRSGVSAMAFPDGRVVISGNWYADDDIEIYEPGSGFSRLKEAAVQRTYPLILQSSADNALIISSKNIRGELLETTVDRLDGDAFRVPLLDQWNVLPYPLSPCSDDEMRIGDYTYLLPAISHIDSSFAVIKVAGEHFSMLEMEHPFPTTSPDGERLIWNTNLQVDHAARQAWVQCYDNSGRLYIGCIDYDATLDGGKASFRIYRAENPGGHFAEGKVLLMPGGRLLLAGGTGLNPDPLTINNFVCGSEVWMFYTEPVAAAGLPGWLWPLCCLVLVGVIAAVMLIRRKAQVEEAPVVDENSLRADLMEQMLKLIEDEELFKRKDLHMEDIARELATNRTYISMLLNNMSGTKFTDLVNGYRIRYAQKLMRENPGMHLDDIADASGFSSRTAFFRNFKAQTGMAPMEWLKKEVEDGNSE